jgi:hypothetical protein
LVGLILAAGLSLLRLAMNSFIDPEKVSLAPVWGFLGIATAVISGAGLSLRPGSQIAWLLSAATAGFLGFFVFPEWDSFALLGKVGAAVCLIVAITLFLPMNLRLAFFGGCIVMHYLGIISAVTSPTPRPWLSQQTWTRVFRPYLHFTYMNNAYQFYSPDPGPARLVWCCVEYQPKEDKLKEYPMPPKDGERGYFRWIKVPLRTTDMVDPLGQSYYRRLSITEYLNNLSIPNYSMTQNELRAIENRRNVREDIPRHPEYVQYAYQPPNTLVQQLYLPSYARRLAIESAHPDFEIKHLRIYRVTHNIIAPHEFRGTETTPRVSPYDPTTYQAFYQGKYDKDGNLLDPFDPMLFWLLPIRKKTTVEKIDAARFAQLEKTDFNEYLLQYKRSYDDYVSLHAGFDHLKGGNLP